MDKKRCAMCRKLKPLDEFNNESAKKDGKKCGCKLCYGKAEKIHREKNKAHRAAVKKVWRKKNLKHVKAKKEEWRKGNMPMERQASRKYRRKRIKTDSQYHTKEVLRGRIRSAISRQYGEKAFSTIELLGCTVAECRDYLEKQFEPGMSWDNHSHEGWHIDHIKPCAAFDLTDPSQQKECFHHTNLQPLWAEDNLAKRADY